VLTDHHASLPIAYRLYLPNKWAEHAGRRKKAHVPEDIDFKIEPRSRLSRSLRLAWRGRGASGRRDHERNCARGSSAGTRDYFGKYFLFNAQAAENCGSTTLAT